MRTASPLVATFGLTALLCASAAAQDWSNLGGNAARNGFAYPLGPRTQSVLWTKAADPSIIAWAPFVDDGRVFTIRESGFPQNGGAANDTLIAWDLDTGNELWRHTLPFGGNTATQWIAWIAGARDGKVYASRSNNGAPNPLRAYDAATGAFLWSSAATTEAFAYDGTVFAPDGDPIVGDFTKVVRIDAASGATVWSTPRVGSVSGNCGAAASPTAVYIVEPVFGGHVLTRLDLATGARLYSSPLMAGFTAQNSPFVSHDGKTVYFARSQNNPPVDNLFAFSDDGLAFTFLWSRPIRWTTSHEHGIGPDGSIYTFLQNDEFVRLDPATGNVLDSAGILAPLGSPNLSAKTAVDARGTVYVSNGWASSPAGDGRLWAFSPDLATTHFTVNLQRPNAGGPAVAEDGTLVMCELPAVRAWREANVPQTYCTAKPTSDGCAPPIWADGVPSASSGSGFQVGAWQVPATKNGLLIYSKTGAASLPFQGGWLCVGGSIKRTPAQNSGGAGSCGGAFDLDFNAYVPISGDPGLVSGASIWAQYWFRDPLALSATGLSNAVQFVLGP
jgi:sugar lactone lactonase YvrE